MVQSCAEYGELMYFAKRLFGTPILWHKQRLLSRFRRQCADIQAVQAQRLARHLEAIDDSAFARDHGLCGIRRLADLKQAIAVGDYSRVAPYVERLGQGETQALFQAETRVLMLATTSGTTASIKRIPVTRESGDEYKTSWTIWGCALARAHPRVPFSRVLTLASSWQTSRTAGGIPCGSISGMLARLMQGMLSSTQALPLSASEVEQSKSRHYLAMRLALMYRDVMVVSTANPSTLINFARDMDRWRESLIRDIYEGGCSAEFACNGGIPEPLRPWLRRKDRTRALELEAAVDATGALYPKNVWPYLSVLGVWTGGTLAPYLQMLPPYYGEAELRDHGLSASEGRLSIPLLGGTASGVLNVASCYYEFIPEAQYGQSNPETLAAHELETGGRYYVVITTSGGLVRYDLADLIECTGWFAATPLIRFLNKSTQFSNLTGEKLSAYQATEAIRRVQNDLGVYLGEWSLAPVFQDPPRYHLLTEDRGLPGSDLAQMLMRRLDALLCELNVEYAEKRRSSRLGTPTLTLIPQGTFQAWAARKQACGATVEQYKHPFLQTDSNLIGELCINSWHHRGSYSTHEVS